MAIRALKILTWLEFFPLSVVNCILEFSFSTALLPPKNTNVRQPEFTLVFSTNSYMFTLLSRLFMLTSKRVKRYNSHQKSIVIWEEFSLLPFLCNFSMKLNTNNHLSLISIKKMSIKIFWALPSSR